MAVDRGAQRARPGRGINPQTIGALYIGSESHPYAVKPSGTVVAEAIGATPEVHVADLEFACKAGTEGMFLATSLVKSGTVKYALGDRRRHLPGGARRRPRVLGRGRRAPPTCSAPTRTVCWSS